jgi:hypothetical protein
MAFGSGDDALGPGAWRATRRVWGRTSISSRYFMYFVADSAFWCRLVAAGQRFIALRGTASGRAA